MELWMSDGDGGNFKRVARVREWTLYYDGDGAHHALHHDESGNQAWGSDPKIPALAEAIARQRCRDRLTPPQEPQP